MIDTGGTMSEAIHALKRLGAEDIFCCATHALLSGPAVDRLKNSPVTEVAVTNTVALSPERKFDKLRILSIAPLLAKAIGYTHSDQSVSSLFD
jgi:ribose-phosphate pyrophosphokinase